MSHFYKLIRALPQSLPGNTEIHYGRVCEIRDNGVWAELTEIDAINFLKGRLIDGPVIPDENKAEKTEKVERKQRTPRKSKKEEPIPEVKIESKVDSIDLDFQKLVDGIDGGNKD